LHKFNTTQDTTSKKTRKACWSVHDEKLWDKLTYVHCHYKMSFYWTPRILSVMKQLILSTKVKNRFLNQLKCQTIQ